jgi:hypothetical protein
MNDREVMRQGAERASDLLTEKAVREKQTEDAERALVGIHLRQPVGRAGLDCVHLRGDVGPGLAPHHGLDELLGSFGARGDRPMGPVIDDVYVTRAGRLVLVSRAEYEASIEG